MIHELKTDPEAFNDVRSGVKRCEIRVNDRDYQVGYSLFLRQTVHTAAQMLAGAPLAYTGEAVMVHVSHIIHGPAYGVPYGQALMSIDLLEKAPAWKPFPTGTEVEVCADIALRQELGVSKYSTTVAANPLPLRDWLQHAYEECLDQAIYLKRAIQEISASAA